MILYRKDTCKLTIIDGERLTRLCYVVFSFTPKGFSLKICGGVLLVGCLIYFSTLLVSCYLVLH
jgi:hypothetical protein